MSSPSGFPLEFIPYLIRGGNDIFRGSLQLMEVVCQRQQTVPHWMVKMDFIIGINRRNLRRVLMGKIENSG